MKTQEVQNHDHLKKVFNYNQVFVKYVMYINIKVRSRESKRERGNTKLSVVVTKVKTFSIWSYDS